MMSFLILIGWAIFIYFAGMVITALILKHGLKRGWKLWGENIPDEKGPASIYLALWFMVALALIFKPLSPLIKFVISKLANFVVGGSDDEEIAI